MPIPFSGKEFTFTNPDGSEVRVRGWGNQFHAVFETLDGYTVAKDPASGFFHYATLSKEKDSLVPSGTKVGQKDPQLLSGKWGQIYFTPPKKNHSPFPIARCEP